MIHDVFDHDALDISMFWVGALFVFAPLVFFGTVLGVWWHTRKRATQSPESPAGAPVQQG